MAGNGLADIPGVQVMGSDMVVSTRLMAFSTYHSAYHLDRGDDAALGANVAKLYATDRFTQTALEEEKLAAIFRTWGRTALIKSTYDGLKEAKPIEYYHKFPDFVDMEREVF